MSQAHFRLAVNLTSAGRRSPWLLSEGGRRGPQQQATLGILEQIASHQSPATICSALPAPNTRRPPPSTNHLPSALRLYPAVSFASSSHFAPFPFCCSALFAPTNVDAPLHHRVAPTPSVDFEPACSCATTVQGDQCAAGNTVGRPIFWPDQQLEPSLTADLFSRAGTRSSRSYTCAPLGDFYVCLDFARCRQ